MHSPTHLQRLSTPKADSRRAANGAGQRAAEVMDLGSTIGPGGRRGPREGHAPRPHRRLGSAAKMPPSFSACRSTTGSAPASPLSRPDFEERKPVPKLTAELCALNDVARVRGLDRGFGPEQPTWASRTDRNQLGTRGIASLLPQRSFGTTMNPLVLGRVLGCRAWRPGAPSVITLRSTTSHGARVFDGLEGSNERCVGRHGVAPL